MPLRWSTRFELNVMYSFILFQLCTCANKCSLYVTNLTNSVSCVENRSLSLMLPAKGAVENLTSSQVRIMRPMGTSVRHSRQMTSVHVDTLESPLQSLSPESPRAPERQEFGLHGLRATEELSATETPLEVSGKATLTSFYVHRPH